MVPGVEGQQQQQTSLKIEILFDKIRQQKYPTKLYTYDILFAVLLHNLSIIFALLAVCCYVLLLFRFWPPYPLPCRAIGVVSEATTTTTAAAGGMAVVVLVLS